MSNLIPSPLTPPTFRNDLPTYPHLLQLLRVTSTAIPGPEGLTSSSVLRALMYVASTQQTRSNFLPRDREPCLVTDVNRLGLNPGYYLGRLVGHFNALPVYEVVRDYPFGCGLTAEQTALLSSNLSQEQLAKLCSLTPCQVQILVTTLNTSQIQLITGGSASLTPCHVANFVINTPIGPGQSSTATLVNFLTINQILNLTTSLTVYQITTIVQTLTVVQIQNLIVSLTVVQLNYIVNVLTIQQLILLSSLTVTQINLLVVSLTVTQLQIFLSLSITNINLLLVTLTINQITNLVINVPCACTIANLISTYFTVNPPSGLPGFFTLSPTAQSNFANYEPSTQQPVLSNMGQTPSTVTANLQEFVTSGPNQNPPPSPVSGNQTNPLYMPEVSAQPSSTPLPFQGYANLLATSAGQLYVKPKSGNWTLVGPASGGGSTGTSFTGTTTASYVLVTTITDAGGLSARASIENTGGVQSLLYQVTVTDLNGNTDTVTDVTLFAGGAVINDETGWQTFSLTQTAPIKTMEIYVKNGTGATTYRVWTSVG